MQERLQKLIAAAGIASRRKAEELIVAGAVTVNGQVVQELGTRADPETDAIKVKGKLINPQLSGKQKVYLLLNKPAGYLSSTSDPQKRPLVTDLVGKYRSRVHPVGRLDFNSEGLLLLTNDGEFHNLITGATSKVPKCYVVKVKGQPAEEQIERLRRGVSIDGYPSVPASLKLVEESATNAWFEVVLYEGRNQQIRKMFEAIGHSVLRLRRTRIGFLRETGLKTGDWRELEPAEVRRFFQHAAAAGKRSQKSAQRPARRAKAVNTTAVKTRSEA